jgi:SAM-dependent methyltransferase
MITGVDPPTCKACNCLKVSSLNISSLPISAQPFDIAPSNALTFETLLFLCDNCGHMYLDIPPVQYYKNVVRSVSVSPEMTSYRRKQFNSITSFFSKPVSEVKVLEIGAGNGQYSKILSEVFTLCYATEANSINTEHSSVHFIDAHPDDCDFGVVMKPFGCFDLVCCFSYLEHLPNPLNTLCQIEQLLAPGGYALLEVPNSDYIRKKGLLSEIIPDHLHYFTARSLVSLASSAQLNLQSLIPVWGDYILSSIFQKPEESKLVISRFSSCHDTLLAEINRQITCYSSDSKIAVWGAGHQSLFILASSLLSKRVSFVIDSSITKQGKYIPGVNVRVSHPSILLLEDISLIFIICAGYNAEVVSSIRGMRLPGPVKVFSVLDNRLNLEDV